MFPTRLSSDRAQDVAAGGAQGATHADLAASLRDPETGQPDDAQRGDQQQRHDRPDQQPGHGAVAAEVAFAQFGQGRGLLLVRSEEHTSELPSLMRNSYAVFCLTKTK